MKISKENIQKIFLGVLVGGGVIYYYFAQMLGPLAVQEKKLGAQVVDLNGKIREGRSKIAQARAVAASDANATEAGRAIEAMREKIPAGQPVAWLPTRLGALFKAQGIAKANYHSEKSGAPTGVPGFHLSLWTVDFPSVSFAALGKAVTGLENEDGLSQITKIQMVAMGDDPENHKAQITFATFAKSEK